MINGILNVKKEAGFTSHDVVAKLRGIVHQKKIGHTGTLDPDATGVLPVCLGKATKLCDMIGDWDKTYEAVLLLGRETDTEDTGGKTLREAEVCVTPEALSEIILSFAGDYAQIPPMYSAKKKNGRKLYELARQGVIVEREPCPVHIFRIVIKEIALPRAVFTVTCSKGTYIRSLCRDIGRKAGCGGCMERLVRTRVADFRLEDAHTLTEIEEMQAAGRLCELLVPIDRMFPLLPAVTVGKEEERRLYNGNPIRTEACLGGGEVFGKDSRFRVYDAQGFFVGIYELEGKDILKPYKLFL